MGINNSTIRQAGVIPIRSGRICLVTSSSGRRWVVPKGCIESGQTAGEAALQEAWEEAGLIGVLQPEPIGSYVYQKCSMLHLVTMFVMDVTKVHDDFPEADLRSRQWSTVNRALVTLDEPGLCRLIRKIYSSGLIASR
ncbi:MAG: NUDIX hydrolase [Gemmataceae bacterium]